MIIIRITIVEILNTSNQTNNNDNNDDNNDDTTNNNNNINHKETGPRSLCLLPERMAEKPEAPS